MSSEQEVKEMEAVIMTGGKGLRMAPYTKVLPKGLLPIGEQPILEIIVKQLQHHGFTSITMACGYLAPLIQTYFQDGSTWGVTIRYLNETKPLGTAGALRNLHERKEPFLVINCDVLTTLSLKQFWEFHQAGNSSLTIASQKKRVPVDFGVLQTEDDRVVDFVEKPQLSESVSMGIYVIDPQILSAIPENQYFDIPDLIRVLLDRKQTVRHFENDSYWLDIGRPADYKLANEEFPHISTLLFPGDRP
jgi:NDP-sugar pyrophosphorylase family protein